jgi:hypothetical protein
VLHPWSFTNGGPIYNLCHNDQEETDPDYQVYFQERTLHCLPVLPATPDFPPVFLKTKNFVNLCFKLYS